ncbi:MAG: ceramidase domain-containing protein [Myxococcota bacterium]
MDNEGVWTEVGAPATVDWCEPNYVHSVYVAEWYNSLSSLPIALMGAVALAWSLRAPWRRTGRFAFAATVLLIVGLGSTAFHATLLRVGQALDELPMVYAGLSFLYVLLARSHEPGDRRLVGLRIGLALFGLAFTAAYLFVTTWFWFFVAAYAGLVALLVLRTGWLSGRAGPMHRRWFAWSAGAYVGGVCFLWVPEHVLLPCDHPVQSAMPHAWFHLTSAVGSYAWLMWAANDRATLIDPTRRPVSTWWPS